MRGSTLGLLLGALAATTGCQQDFEERVPAQPGGRLEVDLDLGDGLRPDPGSLDIVSREADEVHVLAEATGWGARSVRLRVTADDGGVRVQGGPSGAFSWLFGGPNVRVRVAVPRRFSADLRCTTGPIRVEELQGDVRARTDDAAVEVSAVEGRVRLRLGEGDVRVSEIVGDVDVRVRAGEVAVEWVRGDVAVRSGGGALDVARVEGAVSARTDRGGIELREVGGPVEAQTERGSIFASLTRETAARLETRRGSVEVRLPEPAAADLDASADRPIELDPQIGLAPSGEGHRVVGPIGGGGAPLKLFSARGSVAVRVR